MSSESDHWERVWSDKDPEETSWFQTEPTLSLELIDAASPRHRVLDIGGGASRLVDALLDRGLDPTVVDLSAAALERAKLRLGDRAERVRWVVGDITQLKPTDIGLTEVWHDRAAFHFLTDASERIRYRRLLHTTVAPQGQVIIATFAPDGPKRCSGLQVQGWDPTDLAEELQLELIESRREVHHTPKGGEQRFSYARMRRP